MHLDDMKVFVNLQEPVLGCCPRVGEKRNFIEADELEKGLMASLFGSCSLTGRILCLHLVSSRNIQEYFRHVLRDGIKSAKRPQVSLAPLGQTRAISHQMRRMELQRYVSLLWSSTVHGIGLV